MSNQCENEYLGYPKDENSWLYYEGECKVFAGVEQRDPFDDLEEDDPHEVDFCEWFFGSYWVMEYEEIVEKNIKEAFEAQGFNVFDVEIYEKNQSDGQYTAIIRCTYNKPVPKNNEFIINGLIENSYDKNPLKFSFTST